MIIEILRYLFSGIGIVIEAFFGVLPIYNQLDSLKEQLIASLFGVPVILVSIVLSIPLIIKITKIIIMHFQK